MLTLIIYKIFIAFTLTILHEVAFQSSNLTRSLTVEKKGVFKGIYLPINPLWTTEHDVKQDQFQYLSANNHKGAQVINSMGHTDGHRQNTHRTQHIDSNALWTKFDMKTSSWAAIRNKPAVNTMSNEVQIHEKCALSDLEPHNDRLK